MKTLDLKTAARHARFDPQRLNELIVDGTYNFAPKTKPGKARQFDLVDVAGLRSFTFFSNCYQNFRFSSKIAAMYAREICSHLRSVSTQTDNGLELPDNLGRADFPVNGFNDDYGLAEKDSPPLFHVRSHSGQTIGSDIATICIDLDALVAQARLVFERADEAAKKKPRREAT